jgi:hypothetical protein
MGDNLLTTALAVWGALLSTVLAALKIIDYRRDRPIILVKLDELGLQFDPRHVVNVSVVGGLGEKRSAAEKRWLRADIINVGRRAAIVTGVLLMLPRGRGFLTGSPASENPVDLNEGKSYAVMWDEEEIMRDYGLTPSQFVVRADHGVGRTRTAWSHGPLARFWKLQRIW